MEFREKQSIYLQIAGYMCEQILLKNWVKGGKVISIRDLAVAMEVNPNTVQRAYDFLQQREIIINKRGIGYFVAEDATVKIINFRKEQFIENELPQFFRNIYLLNIPLDDIKTGYEKFINENFKENRS